MSETKNLTAAICAVMSEVGTLEKDGHNAFSDYWFTTEAMVVNTLRPLLVKHGLAFVPHNISIVSEAEAVGGREKMRRVAISATYLLMHVSGESITVTVPGEGMDSLDKSTNKCLTAAYKYALLQTFCVGRGEDGDEGKGYETPKVSENAAVRAAAAAVAPRQDDGGYVFTFGKHSGRSIRNVEMSYLDWLMAESETQIKDPSKANFKIKNKKMIDLILDEKQRRGKNAMPEEEPEMPF